MRSDAVATETEDPGTIRGSRPESGAPTPGIDELRASERQFRAVVANIPGVVYRCACDASWTMTFMSDHIEALSGYPAADFLDNRVRTYTSIIHPDDRLQVIAEIDRGMLDGVPYSVEYRLLHADGSERWIAEYGRAVLDEQDRSLWLDGVILDVSGRKLAERARDRAEERLRRQAALNHHQARHDALTGLPNRTLFRQRLSRAVLSTRRSRREFAVLAMDLDHFKQINDTLGHAAGDDLLLAVAERLRGAVRASDWVGRLGGDEFALLLLPGTDAAMAVKMVQRIRSALSGPFMLDGLLVQIEASFGIACYPAHGADVDLLLRRADVAMYVAKHGRSGYAVYDPERDDHGPSPMAQMRGSR